MLPNELLEDVDNMADEMTYESTLGWCLYQFQALRSVQTCLLMGWLQIESSTLNTWKKFFFLLNTQYCFAHVCSYTTWAERMRIKGQEAYGFCPLGYSLEPMTVIFMNEDSPRTYLFCFLAALFKLWCLIWYVLKISVNHLESFLGEKQHTN